MPLALDPTVFDDVLADVRRVCDDLHRDRRVAAGYVDDLVGGGWSGRASDAFVDGWSDWCAAADDAVDTLTAIAAAMSAARAGLLCVDGDAGRSISELAARLG